MTTYTEYFSDKIKGHSATTGTIVITTNADEERVTGSLKLIDLSADDGSVFFSAAR